MPRRADLRAPGRKAVALAAAVAAAAAAALGAGAALGGGQEQAEGHAWRTAFERRGGLSFGRRMIVVLAAPSLADRVAEAGRLPAPAAQRRLVRKAELLQRRLLAVLQARGIRIRPEHVFTRTLNGFSAVLGPRALAALEEAPGVLGVYPVRAVYPAALSSRALSRPELLGRHGISVPGLDGSGVTVALLDTGVDRAHPSLRGRVLWGVDLVEGDRHAEPEPSPDDPERVETHGTRLAGIVVGRGGPNGVTGVAPGAKVLPIRILGWERGPDGRYVAAGRGDVLLAGLERAVDPDGDGDVEDAVDIALAGVVEPYASFADSPEAHAVAGAATLGTLVVAPVGNDGPAAGAAFGTVGAPAGAPAALAVGAADGRPAVSASRLAIRVDGVEVVSERASLLGGLPPGELELRAEVPAGPTLADPARPAGVTASGAALGDFFDAFGRSRVAGTAALVPADGAPLLPKIRNAVKAGAAAVLVYGTVLPAGAAGLSEEGAVPVLGISGEAGRAVAQARADGREVTVFLGRAGPVANPDAGEVAGFSSEGPAFAAAKPDLVAPGVALATPDAAPDGASPRFAAVTGTSAAAAVAAGAAALVREARPDLGAAGLRSVLVGSAKPLAGGRAEPVTAQGAGLVDPAAAAAAALAVEPATLSFGRATGAEWRGERTITVRNVSAGPLEVSLGVATDLGAAVEVGFAADPAEARLEPGAAVTMRVVASAASGSASPATVAGALVVQAAGAEPARVPFAVVFGAPGHHLLSEVTLAPSRFVPSDREPAVLAFRAGLASEEPGGAVVDPVGMLEVELSTAKGRVLGVVARLRDLLPGRYALGITGRAPDGRRLRPGRYVLTLRAYAPDARAGEGPAATARAAFRIAARAAGR